MSFLPNTELDRAEMLEALGLESVEQLFDRAVPPSIPRSRPGLPNAMSEMEVQKRLEELGRRNCDSGRALSFLGAGAYEHFIPAAVRTIVSRGEFATCYTPYQAEVSQGTLQAAFEFQTMIAELTGMEVANASLYDGASALAEAALMAMRLTRRRKILVSGAVHPHHIRVLETYTSGVGADLHFLPAHEGVTGADRIAERADSDAAAVIIQNPNFFGCIEDLDEAASAAKGAGALFVVSANPISLGILKDPGSAGADIVVGEGQPLGIPLSFGGPYLGFMATRQDYVRQMPGRLIGMARDSRGRRGFVMTLQAREQHIRREKATSNICTNEALAALTAAVYLALVGPEGLRRIALLNLETSRTLSAPLSSIPGCSLRFSRPFFNEFVLKLPRRAEEVARMLVQKGIIAGLPLGRCFPDMSDCLLVCATETKTQPDLDRFALGLEEVLGM
jgi:glycine dehydrogenase subunit 1